MNKRRVLNGLRVVISFIHLSLRKITNRIRRHPCTLVSVHSTIRTEGCNGIVRIGKLCCVRPNTEISAANSEIILGQRVFINRNCVITARERIALGDNTTIGPGTYIYDHDHDGLGGYKTKAISIENNVWIGAGCIILKGVSIGHDSVIGAGSVITHDVPPNSHVIQKRVTTYIPTTCEK